MCISSYNRLRLNYIVDGACLATILSGCNGHHIICEHQHTSMTLAILKEDVLIRVLRTQDDPEETQHSGPGNPETC
ncbi:hypothetical protein KQX54_003702 [Cotesia glomerata]|uniref:Uncharacterized protein n=1 Tax=Cotesia glomerata TaxID=32391 RepID=A0AAV7HUJ9_COTGL|nr:hypothetical protein KQX54_003702 [Cotesia glomerata]